MTTRRIRAGHRPLLAFCAVLFAACASDSGPPPIEPENDLFHPSVGRRLAAVQEVAETRDERYVGVLVDLLEDVDASVRMSANQALEQITGKETGYQAFAPVGERRADIAEWRALIAGETDDPNGASPFPPPTGAAPTATDSGVVASIDGVPPTGPLPTPVPEGGSR